MRRFKLRVEARGAFYSLSRPVRDYVRFEG